MSPANRVVATSKTIAPSTAAYPWIGEELPDASSGSARIQVVELRDRFAHHLLLVVSGSRGGNGSVSSCMRGRQRPAWQRAPHYWSRISRSAQSSPDSGSLSEIMPDDIARTRTASSRR